MKSNAIKEFVKDLQSFEKDFVKEVEPELQQIVSKFLKKYKESIKGFSSELEEQDKLWIINLILERVVDMIKVYLSCEVWLEENK